MLQHLDRTNFYTLPVSCLFLGTAMLLTACSDSSVSEPASTPVVVHSASPKTTVPAMIDSTYIDPISVNVAGGTLVSSTGSVYVEETSISGGQVGAIDQVKGTSDSALFSTYREGDLQIDQQLAPAKYDLTLYFAEPQNLKAHERVFDVFAEDQLIIKDLDVMLFRDGKVVSALTVTVPDISVTDGELNVNFKASAGKPILSAFTIRQKIPRSAQWQLVWQDEFSGTELDANKWTPNLWSARHVNDEDQAYTERTKNIRVKDGFLILEAHKEDYNDAKYTSGRIHSQGKGDFLYGRFEVRAKLPHGQGTWPAIWMLPSNPFTHATTCTDDADWQGSDECDAWPNSGEIDIMEHVGYQMNHVHGTVHTKAYYWINWEQRKGRILLDEVDQTFHVYSVEWSPTRIDAYVDDTLYFSYMNDNNGWKEWPFDHPFHLIMNVAVGGFWGRAGGPIDETIFPQRLVVDYARVYAKEIN